MANSGKLSLAVKLTLAVCAVVAFGVFCVIQSNNLAVTAPDRHVKQPYVLTADHSESQPPSPPSAPATSPAPSNAPKFDPAELQESEVILLYWCGDNVAIQHVYINFIGNSNVKTYNRQDFVARELGDVYDAELHRLEPFVGTDKYDVPVHHHELNRTCIKT